VTCDSLKIPGHYKGLFWDADFKLLSWRKDRRYIAFRILEYGTLEAVRWLLDRMGREELREIIVKGGGKRLSPKTLNFWKAILNLEEDECSKISSQKNSNPFWRF